MDKETLIKKEFKQMMELLISHGGDAGGAYFSYPDGLEEAIEKIKDRLGLSKYEVIWTEMSKNGYTYSRYPILIEKTVF